MKVLVTNATEVTNVFCAICHLFSLFLKIFSMFSTSSDKSDNSISVDENKRRENANNRSGISKYSVVSFSSSIRPDLSLLSLASPA